MNNSFSMRRIASRKNCFFHGVCFCLSNFFCEVATLRKKFAKAMYFYSFNASNFWTVECRKEWKCLWIAERFDSNIVNGVCSPKQSLWKKSAGFGPLFYKIGHSYRKNVEYDLECIVSFCNKPWIASPPL